MKKIFLFILFTSIFGQSKSSNVFDFIELNKVENEVLCQEEVCLSTEKNITTEEIENAAQSFELIEMVSSEETCILDSTQEYVNSKSILQNETPCSCGAKDAELYHNQNMLFGLGGFCLSWPAVVIAAVYEPEPNLKAPAIAKSKDLNTFEYRECYSKKAKNKNLKASLIGAGANLAAIVVAYIGMIILLSGVI